MPDKMYYVRDLDCGLRARDLARLLKGKQDSEDKTILHGFISRLRAKLDCDLAYAHNLGRF
jgi:hypothetical protein